MQEGSLDPDSAHMLTQQLSERQVGVAQDLASLKEQQFRLLRERMAARKEARRRRVTERQEKYKKEVSDSLPSNSWVCPVQHEQCAPFRAGEQ